MELNIGTLLQARKSKTIILVTDISDHWITYKPIFHNLGWAEIDLVNRVQMTEILALINSRHWRIIG